MKTTVIFDLDGLLIDSEIISYQLYRDLTEKYGRYITIEEYAHNYSGKTGSSNMQTLIDAYRLPITPEEGFAFASAREQEYLQNGVALKPGARELLSYLKDRRYKIVLASSSTRTRAIDILTQNKIDRYFDDMVFGTEIKRGKPYPDIFLKACEKAEEIPENCLVLEDSEAGIQAAYSAGIDVICIPDMKVPDSAFHQMMTAELSSLKDVISWLDKAVSPCAELPII